MSVHMTRAPSAARPAASAPPMLALAPVTIAVLPFKRLTG